MEFDRWQVGKVRVTRIVEHEDHGVPPGLVIDGLDPARVRSLPWLCPHYADPEGTLKSSIHAFVIETEGRRIVVDTCIGNDKPRNHPGWNMTSVPFLERMTEAGFAPDTIDLVLCTHMHIDHVGWNTRWDGTAWLPTFTNARYLFARLEWEHWSASDHGPGDVPDDIGLFIETDNVIVDSVQPIIDAGLHELVETDHRLTREVRLFATPGHTPGHVSVRIESEGQVAIITGDMAHHPIQFADPSLCSNFDDNKARSAETRRAFVAEHVGRDVLILGTHFTAPTGGRIVSADGELRFAPSTLSARQM
jgi:glyoxylase-like metal-dependent hydrolase (beta-lactamase superfamily II)